MKFLKTTAQAVDEERGEYQGWNVALSVTESPEDSEAYRKRLRESVEERETAWGIRPHI